MTVKMFRLSRLAVTVVLLSLLVPAVPAVKGSPFTPTTAYDYGWADDFGVSTLHPLWSWINEVPDQWSLTDRPGYLRIITSSEPVGGQNLLVQQAPSSDYQISIHLLFEPTDNFQIAGLLIYEDQQNYLLLGRAYCDLGPPACIGNGIYFDGVEGGNFLGNFATAVAEPGEAYLRITRVGADYSGYYSENGTDWMLIGTHTLGSATTLHGVGLTAAQDTAGIGLPADFDSFALEADLLSLGCSETDGFDGPPLGSQWSWINEDPSQWSLTDRPGYLRIVTDDEPVGAANLLVQPVPAGDYAVFTRVEFTPTDNFQIAGIAVYQDQNNMLMLGRAYCDVPPPGCVGNGIYFDGVEDGNFLGNFATAVPDPNDAHLLVVREAETYSGYYSPDGSGWTLIGRHTLSVSPDLPYVGVTAAQDYQQIGIPADFDVFELAWSCNLYLPIALRNQ